MTTKGITVEEITILSERIIGCFEDGVVFSNAADLSVSYGQILAEVILAYEQLPEDLKDIERGSRFCFSYLSVDHADTLDGVTVILDEDPTNSCIFINCTKEIDFPEWQKPVVIDAKAFRLDRLNPTEQEDFVLRYTVESDEDDSDE